MESGTTSLNTNDLKPLVTTHDPDLPNSFKIIKSNLPILLKSEKVIIGQRGIDIIAEDIQNI